MAEDDATAWDVFVSYTKTDRRWAEWIAWQLEDAGWRVLIQAWDMVPGSNWVHAMDEGAQRARRTLAVMSSDYLASVYGTAEWEVAWSADPLGLRRKLLTVRVEDCERPGLLGTIVGIDLFGVAEHEARQRLVDAVRAAIAGRARPTTPPAFPGAGPAIVPPEFPRKT
jgi:hypothetical protein